MCCQYDSAGCEVNTAAIAWPISCVSFNVHESGSQKSDISASELSDVLDVAMDQWLSAQCAEGAVDLAIENRGKSECGTPEYNLGSKDRNANVWMFRDSGSATGSSDGDSMQLDASALAVTTVSFNDTTAEIFDVDVELLSAVADFTVGDEAIGIDLASVVTHEAGHFLGLDHSRESESTMSAVYSPGSIEPRSLSEDDEAGICAVYPEGRSYPGGKTCEPRGKYSTKCETGGCGCRVLSSRDTGVPGAGWLSLLLLGGLAARRRFSGQRARG